MPGLLVEMDAAGTPIPKVPKYGFTVQHQKVELDIDFSTQSLTGKVTLTILPETNDLRDVKIDARQCTIQDGCVLVGIVEKDEAGKDLVDYKAAEFEYEDPMKAMNIPEYYVWDAHQHKQMRERLGPLIQDSRANGALLIEFPKSVRVEEAPSESLSGGNAIAQRALDATAARSSSVALDSSAIPQSAVSAAPKTAVEPLSMYKAMSISISFSIPKFRDGLHFIGVAEGDTRYPHAYSKHSLDPGTASCIFPCIDDPAMRCTWDITIRCARTLGDALKRQLAPRNHRTLQHLLHRKGLPGGAPLPAPEEYEVPLSEDEKLLEMTILCSGEIQNETIDVEDSSKKVANFVINSIVAAQHVGLAIGPFEQIDLAEFREAEDDEKLGQSQSVPIFAYCLPGRAEEVRHTCMPLVHALDYFMFTYATAYPFEEKRFVFVDDQIRDVEHTSSLSICSTRLLFPTDITDPEVENVRTLVHAIASQWIGVLVVPEKVSDRWVTIGLSHFMTDLCMKTLIGTNEYYFRMKALSDKLVSLDVDRPSLHALGHTLHLGDFEHDFMKLKAPLVIFILDKRCQKASGSVGIVRVLSRLFTLANTGTTSDSLVSTDSFRRLTEKITKYRQTDPFFNQWVLGAGCPKLLIQQKFNKKRLCVEITITQKREPVDLKNPQPLEQAAFMREVKEDICGVYAGEVQPFFTGPMTIRIHEADGTPYEHIVDIKDGSSKIEIPYSTKYKRLRRKKPQTQRQTAAAGLSEDVSDEALYYCLGDVLQAEDDIKEWNLQTWSPDQEHAMTHEFYEWIRVDADFEWLCTKEFITGMPSYMYVSQLQQDRDVVAQQESLQFLLSQSYSGLVSTFLVRTLMDPRYFHGIRTMAAEGLAKHECLMVEDPKDPAPPGQKRNVPCGHLGKAYKELFCYPGSVTPRPNDFRDKKAYKVEKAVIKGLSQIRNKFGKCPKDVRDYILDSLRFNDNANNELSDYFKITNLLSALADSIIIKKDPNVASIEGETDTEIRDFDKYKLNVLSELERYRRMDEWINSYQNVFTVTVLDCRQRLMKAKVIPADALEFAQYLHDGTSDFVRIKAFYALVDLGYMSFNRVTSLLLVNLSTDPSPYTREHLMHVFYNGLANFAFGDVKAAESAPTSSFSTLALSVPPTQIDINTQESINASATDVNGDIEMTGQDRASSTTASNGTLGGTNPKDVSGDLVVEEDISLESRKAQAARTTTIEGALAALKEELKNNEVLQNALWKAVKSPIITLHEQTDLLDICSILYDAVESMTIKMKYPHVWSAKYLGKGVLHFKTTNKIRTKASKPLPVKVVEPVRSTIVLGPPKITIPKALVGPPKITIPKATGPPSSSTKLTFSASPSGGITIKQPLMNSRTPLVNTKRPRDSPETPPMAPKVSVVNPRPSQPLTSSRPTLTLKRPHAPDASSILVERPRKIMKLKVPPQQLARIARSAPRPALIRHKSSTDSASPGQRASPGPGAKAPSAPRASPAPAFPTPLRQSIASPSPGPSGHPTTILKIRKALPTGPSSVRKALPDTGPTRNPLPATGGTIKIERKPLPMPERKPLPSASARPLAEAKIGAPSAKPPLASNAKPKRSLVIKLKANPIVRPPSHRT